jgi:hypothetical protein
VCVCDQNVPFCENFLHTNVSQSILQASPCR